MSDSARKPFTPVDLLHFELVGDPQISPDGTRVAFVRTVVDARNNRYRSAIMVAPVPGTAAGRGTKAARGKPADPVTGVGAAVPFTSGLARDTSPRWSPDGRYLAFLSARDPGVGDEAAKKAEAQIWVASTSGGEARPVTALKGGVSRFVWSPDGRRIAFTAAVKPQGPEWLDEKAEGKARGGEEEACRDLASLFRKFNEDVKHITRIHYRQDGEGYLESKRSQVFVLDVEAALRGLPEPGRGPAFRPVQVTSGEFDHSSPAWSPDGRFLAVCACRDENPELRRYEDVWVFAVPGAGSPAGPGESAYPKRLTLSSGPVGKPVWSPDGRRVAYLGHENELLWYTDTKLWVVEVGPDGAPEGKPRCLTRAFGRSLGDQSIYDLREGAVDDPIWSPDGKRLFLLASDHGTTHLCAVDAASGEVRQLTTGDRVVFGWSADAARRTFAFAVADPDSPSDIYVGRLPEDANPATWPAAPAGLAAPAVVGLDPLTRTNAGLLAARTVSRPERFTFAAPGGPPVDGWAIRPVGRGVDEHTGSSGGGPGDRLGNEQEIGRYPAVLQIHGGPMAMYTGAFFFEFQLLASAGIGVIYANPRGSQGYGEEFCAGIKDEWGQSDYADLMASVDEALRRFPWIDPDRLGVAGGSYGGYMTSWIVGHTDRFKAACSMRAVNNCHSFFGTSDTGYEWDEIWHGTPWKDWENLIRQSPITYAGNVKTPTLIIHSEEDHGCLIEQGEQFYVALRKLGVEAEFIRYPGEGHELSRHGKPWHRVHRLKSIVEWFERHLRQQERAGLAP